MDWTGLQQRNKASPFLTPRLPYNPVRLSHNRLYISRHTLHCIFARYHSFRLHTFWRRNFWEFEFFYWPPECHVTGNHRNTYSTIFLESSIVACIDFRQMPLQETKLQPQEFRKCLCLSRPHGICWPLSLKKKNKTKQKTALENVCYRFEWL